MNSSFEKALPFGYTHGTSIPVQLFSWLPFFDGVIFILVDF